MVDVPHEEAEYELVQLVSGLARALVVRMNWSGVQSDRGSPSMVVASIYYTGLGPLPLKGVNKYI